MKLPRMPLFAVGILLCIGSASGQSTRGGMGAVPYADDNGTGVTFRTWAPNASYVNVRGSFNGWGTTAMAPDPSGGTWSVDSSRARAGDEYKFDINGSWRKDPRSLRVVNSAGNSIIYQPGQFDWGGSTNFSPIWRNDLVIYEMHVGSYNAEDWLPSTFDECGEKIGYLKSLGISAVQLMPINEFPGDRSWGYNPSDPYAIESSFGGPDGFKRFVKTCHENGIGVILDVVHNHYGPSDLGDGLWQYDGWSQNGLGGIYFYNDWKAHTDWGSTRPDYGRGEVRTYIKDQIRLFLEEYRVDGFRWDSVYNIRNASGTWNQDGSDMLYDINQMMISEFPDAYRISEDHAFDTDVGFEAQWDHGYLSDIRWLATAASDSDRNMNTLAYHLGNGGFTRVVYVESHDTCGDLNNKHRLPYDIDSANSWSYYAKKRALLGNMIVLISPGIPMIFEGSEMHEDWTFSNNTALRWSLTNTFAGIVQAYSDLIHLRRNAYGNTEALKGTGNVNVHHINNTDKVVGAIREDLMIILNCSATAFTGYGMAFSSPGTWYCLYNSDSLDYNDEFGGVGPAVGSSVTADGSSNTSLDLGAYSLQIYSKTPIPAESAVAFDPPAPSGCGTALTIDYDPGDGPLASAANVYAFIGRNNWSYPSNVQMTATGATWTLTYAIPDDTYELNLSFTDGADAWDNNGGANWSVPVANCGDLPAEVTLNPVSPQGCIPLQISYEANGGPLMGATELHLYIGRNDWKNILDVTMDSAGGDLWTATHQIPDDTWQLDFVFHDETNRWDNNNGGDWHVVVAGCINTEQPQLAITSPVPNTTVASTTTVHALHGTSSLLTGNLRWTNTLNGATGSVPADSDWTIASVNLAEGVNLIRLSGTNSAVNPNDGAEDSPTNSTYVASLTWSDGWSDGQNAGRQFDPWEISTGASSFLAASNTECSFASASYAWALQAAGGGFIQAIRPFAVSLQPGDEVSFVIENGGIDSPGSVGVAFHNRFEQRLAEFYFEGGTTNYVVNDTSVRNTGIPWSPDTKTGTFEMLSSLDYRLTINGQAFEGEFADASEYAIAYVRFWNWNAGSGNDHTFFIGDLSVTGAPLPVMTYNAEVDITRQVHDWCITESVLSTGSGLIATVNNGTGIAGNIWSADTLSNGGWNWSIMPENDYVISNNTVTITPSSTGVLQIISIGQPGGL